MEISKRVAAVPASAAMLLDRKAKEMASQGLDVINFTVGEPDFVMPRHAIQAALDAMSAGNMKYTPAAGTDRLKKAVCTALYRDSGLFYTPAQIAVTTGAKYACYAAVCALCDPGDEVIIPAPYWTSYRYLTELARAVPVEVPCPAENGYKLTPELLENAVSERSRVLIINNPNNPTGAVYTREELDAVCSLAVRKGLAIIADEIYSALNYTGAPVTSVPSLSWAVKRNTVLISGVSKAYAMTGWRIGYMAADENVIKAVSALLSHTTGCPTAVGQEAAAAALEGPQTLAPEMMEVFAERRQVICEAAAEAGFTFPVPEGAFYLFADVRPLLREGQTATDFAMELLEHTAVACVPCDEFGAPGHLRFSYCVPVDSIREAFLRIKEYLENRDG